MAKELVMLMGAQRSGTNALFGSLATDSRVTAFNESIDSAIYRNYRLRPEPEIAEVLRAATGPVLLKPLSETFYRTLETVFDEFRAYAVRIVWVYRDPVNVFYSMHQAGWLPFNEIGNDSQIEQWNKRNWLAHEFYQRHPPLIAILRYEDLLVDSRVFEALCGWLQIESKSFFRSDSGNGRKQVPPAVQSKIDSRTAEVLQALDVARLFRPQRRQRLRHRFVQKIARDKIISGAVPRSCSEPSQGEWNDLLAATQPCVPSEIAELKFWLDCGENLQSTGKLLARLRESGPCRLSAATPVNGPYYISSCLNVKPALVFPAEKGEARRERPCGILEFGAEHDWMFMFDGSPFAVFAIFQPSVPIYPSSMQERAVLIRVGVSGRSGPAFILQWNGKSNASEAILIGQNAERNSGTEQQVASTPRGSHPHAQWRLINVQHTGEGEGVLLSFANGVPGVPCPGNATHARPKTSLRSALELGGAKGETESLFFGAVAEIIIFADSLKDEQRIGITRYLKEKYRL